MTNLEKYNKILKRNLQATDEDLNDDVLVYNRFKRWESVRHVDMVADLEEAFGGKAPDYLVVSHLEPDHAGNIRKFLVKYPQTVVVANAKTVAMLPQFFELDTEELSILEVKEGDTLKLGRHTLHFVMAPMVHWPEVMVSYG